MKWIAVMGAGLVLFALVAGASDLDAPLAVEPGANQLTLDKAIETALAKNLQIEAARCGEDASRWAEYRAIGGWFPTVDFNTVYTYIDDESVDRANAPTEAVANFFGIDDLDLVTNETYQHNLRVTQPIINGGKEIGAIQAGRAGHREKREALNDTVRQTVLNVSTAYISAVEARQIRETATEATKLAEETLRLTKNRYELGEAAKADTLRFEAEAAKASVSEIGAQNSYELSMISLVNVLGERLDTDYTLPHFRDDLDAGWYRDRMNRMGVQADGIEDTIGSISAHPAVQRMDALEDGATAQEILAWSEVLPSLNFGYQYNWETDDDIWLDGNESWAATVYFQMPLFDSLRGAFGIVEARKQRKQAEISREDVERGLLQRAMSARRSMNNAYLRIGASGKSRAFADENLKTVRERQQIGEASYLEVLDAQLSYVQARTDYVRAVADFLRAEAEWRYLHAEGTE